jgi:hypothetical protein
MRKAISGIAMLVGVLFVVIGLVVCMCETADFSKQVLNMVYGMATMAVGAILCYLGKEGSECYGNR